jgi:hypothetical protein
MNNHKFMMKNKKRGKDKFQKSNSYQNQEGLNLNSQYHQF